MRILVAVLLAILALGTMPMNAFAGSRPNLAALPDDPGYPD